MRWLRLLTAMAIATSLFAPATLALAQKRQARKSRVKHTSNAPSSGRVLPPINYTEFKLDNGMRVCRSHQRRCSKSWTL